MSIGFTTHINRPRDIKNILKHLECADAQLMSLAFSMYVFIERTAIEDWEDSKIKFMTGFGLAEKACDEVFQFLKNRGLIKQDV